MGGRGGRVFFFGAAPADLARRAKNKMLNIFFLRLLAFMLYYVPNTSLQFFFVEAGNIHRLVKAI